MEGVSSPVADHRSPGCCRARGHGEYSRVEDISSGAFVVSLRLRSGSKRALVRRTPHYGRDRGNDRMQVLVSARGQWPRQSDRPPVTCTGCPYGRRVCVPRGTSADCAEYRVCLAVHLGAAPIRHMAQQHAPHGPLGDVVPVCSIWYVAEQVAGASGPLGFCAQDTAMC